MANDSLISSLMMVAGAIHDIGEKSNEGTTKQQCTDVEARIVDILKTHFPLTLNEILKQ